MPVPWIPFSPEADGAPVPDLRDEHEAQGKDRLTGAVPAMAIAGTLATYKGGENGLSAQLGQPGPICVGSPEAVACFASTPEAVQLLEPLIQRRVVRAELAERDGGA